jgi:hypothetical protein
MLTLLAPSIPVRMGGSAPINYKVRGERAQIVMLTFTTIRQMRELCAEHESTSTWTLYIEILLYHISMEMTRVY